MAGLIARRMTPSEEEKINDFTKVATLFANKTVGRNNNGWSYAFHTKVDELAIKAGLRIGKDEIIKIGKEHGITITE